MSRKRKFWDKDWAIEISSYGLVEIWDFSVSEDWEKGNIEDFKNSDIVIYFDYIFGVLHTQTQIELSFLHNTEGEGLKEVVLFRKDINIKKFEDLDLSEGN